MAREAYFLIDCSSYSNSITQVIIALNQIGWSYSDNQMEYLPFHDNNDFDWQYESLSVEKLFSIITSKQELGELCGIVLYHQYSDKGITILAKETKEMMISININRKKIQENFSKMPFYADYTDVSWYIENIIMKLEKIGCTIESIKYSEVVG